MLQSQRLVSIRACWLVVVVGFPKQFALSSSSARQFSYLLLFVERDSDCSPHVSAMIIIEEHAVAWILDRVVTVLRLSC